MSDTTTPAGGLRGARRLVLYAIVAVLVLSVAARAVVGGGGADEAPPEDGATSSTSGLAPDSFVGGEPRSFPWEGSSDGATAEPAPEEGLEAWLPYLTEGSFFALIGFALGYATKKVVKLALIGLALLFAVLQGLTYADVVTVDWGQAVELLNQLVFNLKEDQTFTEVLQDKLPTTGGFVGGFLLGFRRG